MPARASATYDPVVVVAYLASAEDSAVHAGGLMFLLGLPTAGLICLVIGLWELSRGRRKQPPPAYPYPPGPPPQAIGYPGWPHPGYPPGAPPRPRTSKSATTLITVGLVLVALGGFGIVSHAARAISSQKDESLLRVGDCISESDYRANRFDARLISGCSDPAATYELAFKGNASDSCPDGKREHSIYERASNHSTTLCFLINLQQGRCYLYISDGEAVSLRPGDCGDSNRVQVKIVQRIDGSTDKTQCPQGSKGVSYPEPARVYCLARADS